RPRGHVRLDGGVGGGPVERRCRHAAGCPRYDERHHRDRNDQRFGCGQRRFADHDARDSEHVANLRRGGDCVDAPGHQPHAHREGRRDDDHHGHDHQCRRLQRDAQRADRPFRYDPGSRQAINRPGQRPRRPHDVVVVAVGQHRGRQSEAQPVEVSVDTSDSMTNVMLIIDVSGSMNSNAGLDDHPTWTRLEAAIAAIDELLDQYENVSYFLSDGEPSAGHGVNSTEQDAWESFLTTNDIISFALGISDAPHTDSLNPIAFDPASGTQLADTPFIVTDLNDLADTLVLTASSASGSLLSETNSFGADGGHVQSITVDGVTYTFDPTANGGAGGITVSGDHSFTYNGTSKTLTV